MGKKKGKKEKKIKGAEKTAMKTEKKAERKLKKILQKKGEKDIEAMIAEFSNQMRPVKEEKCPPPSPRCNMSLTAHPDKDELFMFGGEFFSGNNTTVYDDFFIYNIKSNEWTKQSLSLMPPPRCSHQVVAVRQGGGQLWLFGGEFSSPSQSQFYHYNDLWVYHIKEKTWVKIDTPGAPSPRSGHRMVQIKKLLIIFGGFRDNARDYHYFNDVHAFNLETYTWVKLDTLGTPPSPRSGFVMAPCTDPPLITIYGGYCKEKVKRDTVMGHTHADMFVLAPESKPESTVPLVWKWTPLKQSGYRPSPRCACSVVTTVGNRAIVFGGVYDHQDEDDDDINGAFFNEMFSLEVEKGKWHEMVIQDKKQSSKKKRRRCKEKLSKEEEDDDDEMMEQVENLRVAEESSVFSVQPGTTSEENFSPSPRMNPMMTIRNGVLYLYGGLIEEGEKQFTMTDFYALDLHKLDKWQVIISDDLNAKVWEESDSDDDDVAMEGDEDSESSSSSSDDDDDDDDEMDISDNAPSIVAGESLEDYFERCKDSWVAKAQAVAQKEGLNVKPKQIVKAARNMAAEFHQQRQ